MSSRAFALHLVLAAGLAGSAAPLLADDRAIDAEGRVFGGTIDDPLPAWKTPPGYQGQAPGLPPMPMAPLATPTGYPDPGRAAWEERRADWLSECRQRFGGNGRTAGGVIGGVIGGVAGSAIAGRGNRTIGAVAGGVAGAVAGSAIGGASDRHRARDYCESYLERYLASYGRSYPTPGYAAGPSYGYANSYPQPQIAYQPVAYQYAIQPMMVMVPVMMAPAAAPAARQQDCQETEVVEEWVTVSRPARRYIQRHVVPDKRVRLVPDKRVRAY